MKRKEFMLGAVAGLAFAAAATAGGVIDWPSAHAGPVSGVSGRLAPTAGAGLAFAPPQGAPLSFADIFQQVAPAVVQIDVKTRVATPRQSFIQIPGFGAVPVPSPNGRGGGEGEREGSGEEGGATAQGSGSGFFISADGFIVTNNHVVADAVEITVKLADARELTARVVGRDESTDLAVLKVDGADFPYVSFEETAQPRVGDWVIAVGNPFGLGGTATAGIVSAVSRQNIDPTTSSYVDFLQIDAAINRGNSGGPTFDIYGRVIGVNSAIYSPTGGSVGIGFAIPASVAKPITDRLMRGESIQRGYLGVQIGPISRDWVAPLGLQSREGAYVVSVTPGGPAERGGLQQGDVVLSLNGQKVIDSNELTRRVGQVSPGDNLRLEIMRDQRRQTLNVRSGTRPSEAELNSEGGATPEAEPNSGAAAAGTEVGGLTVAPMSPALRQRYEIPANVNGLVITQQGRGENRAYQPGFVIMRSGRGAVNSVADLQAAVEAARQAGTGVFLLVWTPQGNVPIVLELPKSE